MAPHRGSWGEIAHQAIQRVNDRLEPGVSLSERVAAVDAAYPFGERSYWPYKAWLKERRSYLSRYGWTPRGQKPEPLFADLPRDPITGRPVIP